MSGEAWLGCWGSDPRLWLRTAVEPSARWLCLTALDGRPVADAAVRSARQHVVGDPAIQELIGRLPDWDAGLALEALRTFAPLPQDLQPPALLEAARTSLGVWRRRSTEHPYTFGHGVSFKTIKWPAVWYSVWMVLDTIGRYPQLWSGPDANPRDRRGVAESVVAHETTQDIPCAG